MMTHSVANTVSNMCEYANANGLLLLLLMNVDDTGDGGVAFYIQKKMSKTKKGYKVRIQRNSAVRG